MTTARECQDSNCSKEHIYADHGLPHGAAVTPDELIGLIHANAVKATAALKRDPPHVEMAMADKKAVAALNDVIFSLLLGDEAEKDPLSIIQISSAFLDVLSALHDDERLCLLIAITAMSERKGTMKKENELRNAERVQKGEPLKALLEELKEVNPTHAP